MKSLRRSLVLAFIAGLVLTGLGLVRAGQTLHAESASMNKQQEAGPEVKIDNFSFTPTNLTVPAGTKVTWTNHDDVPHTVVSTDQKFKSKALDTDESFSNTFNEPGTYEYFCSLHPKMVAKVTVEANK